jgi:hypothetical protein
MQTCGMAPNGCSCACASRRHACRLRVLPLHQADPAWRFQDFLKQQRQQSRPQQQQAHQSMQQVAAVHLQDKRHNQPLHQQQQQQSNTAGPVPWRDLYYLTWGHVTVLYCTACHQHFPARQYSHCSFHPLAPVFASEAAAGQYPCCGRPAWRPGLALAHSQGCCATQHQAALQVQQPSPLRQQQPRRQHVIYSRPLLSMCTRCCFGECAALLLNIMTATPMFCCNCCAVSPTAVAAGRAAGYCCAGFAAAAVLWQHNHRAICAATTTSSSRFGVQQRWCWLQQEQ